MRNFKCYIEIKSISFYRILLQSDISCRAFHVLLGFTFHFALWLHIALMIEPYVMAVFPKKLNSISSQERAHYLTLLLLTVFIIVNMNYFWTIKRQKVCVQYLCLLPKDVSMHCPMLYKICVGLNRQNCT